MPKHFASLWALAVALAVATPLAARPAHHPRHGPPSIQRSFQVFFDFQQASLTPLTLQTIQAAAARAVHLAAANIDVVGHTDAAEADSPAARAAVRACRKTARRGPDPTCGFANRSADELSLARADAVARELTRDIALAKKLVNDSTQANAPAPAITTEGVGDRLPLARTPPGVDEPQNRYVSITID